VHATSQCALIGQGAAVEDRIAFAPRGDQLRLGQHLEMVAHPRLTDRENLCQLQYPERIARERTQHIEAQWVIARLAQGSQFIEGLGTDVGGG
jgi:hypothetical protein